MVNKEGGQIIPDGIQMEEVACPYHGGVTATMCDTLRVHQFMFMCLCVHYFDLT